MDVSQYKLDKLESLYCYWVSCDDIWFYVNQTIDMPEEWVENFISEELKGESTSEELKKEFKIRHGFYRLTIAYGLLYVVIEGYQKLNLVNENIDLLLKEKEHVENLKRLRNAIFHFHNGFVNHKKVMNFINRDDSDIWVNNLKRAFGDFFKEQIPFVREFFKKYGKKE